MRMTRIINDSDSVTANADGDLAQFETVPPKTTRGGYTRDAIPVDGPHQSGFVVRSRMQSQYNLDASRLQGIISSMPGNPRFDPFDCYPLQLQTSEHILVDHFMQVSILLEILGPVDIEVC